MNMTTALAVLRALAVLLPVILELLKSLDSLPGNGADKLAVALKAVETAFSQVQGLSIDWATFKPVVEKLIDPLLSLIRNGAKAPVSVSRAQVEYPPQTEKS